jgi:hypothetical protein
MGINVNYNLTMASAYSLCGFSFVRPNWNTKDKNRGQLEIKKVEETSGVNEDHIV